MKKFWNLMLAALVIFGAVACTEKEVAPEQNAGMSFTATIDLDETRTDVVFNETEKVWETVWTGNETLVVSPKIGLPIPCYFTNTPSNPNKFTCADASSVVGKSVKIKLVQANDSDMDSKAGKAGGSLYAEVDNFTADSNVTLSVGTAFLRYSSASEVTLSTAGSYIFDYSGNAHDSITLPAGEDVWVAVKPGTVNLSYSIDGDVVKTKEDLTIEAKKIYNLGTLAPIYNVYVLPQPKSAISKWTTFNLYTWGENGVNNTWPGVDITANTKEINGYTYYAYQYPTEFVGQTVNVIVNNGTSQTNDIKLGELNTDYYVVVNSLTEWTVYTTAPAAGSVPEVEAKVVEDPKPDTVSVYLTTTWSDWGTYKLYGFGGTNASWGTFNNWDNCPSSYNQVIDGVTYKSWDIPASCIGKSGTTIIVRGTAGKQTADYPITFEAGKDVFITLEWKDEKNGSITVIDSPYTK